MFKDAHPSPSIYWCQSWPCVDRNSISKGTSGNYENTYHKSSCKWCHLKICQDGEWAVKGTRTWDWQKESQWEIILKIEDWDYWTPHHKTWAKRGPNTWGLFTTYLERWTFSSRSNGWEWKVPDFHMVKVATASQQRLQPEVLAHRRMIFLSISPISESQINF